MRRLPYLLAGTLVGAAFAGAAVPAPSAVDKQALLAARTAAEIQTLLGAAGKKPQEGGVQIAAPEVSLADESIPLSVTVETSPWEVAVLASRCPTLRVLAVVEAGELKNASDAQFAATARCQSSGAVFVWVKAGENVSTATRRLHVASPIR